MKTTPAVALLSGLLLITGCAQHYVITTQTGSQIGTKGKPHLKNGVYSYTDAMGRESVIPAGSVTQIAPASMDDGADAKFKGPTSKK
jgi:hypothetical protein